jgi:hypothetical protein
MNPQLIPKARRHKRQPTADVMREQLRLAADEIIRLRTEREWANRHMVAGTWRVPLSWGDDLPRPWYRRLFNRIRARVVETDPETAAGMPPMEER